MPHNWQRICCPVDFSACSRAALDQAVSLAFHTGAEIFLLHAMEPPVDTLVSASGTWTPGVLSQLEQDLTDELSSWQQAALDAGADHVASEVIVSPHLRTAIVQYAIQHRLRRLRAGQPRRRALDPGGGRGGRRGAASGHRSGRRGQPAPRLSPGAEARGRLSARPTAWRAGRG
ncbi:MAG: universal stress protein [Deltaproteobacteria bacterium]|nr:universal stress protein [Deltaproteobacteria bacterium]